MQQVPVAPKVEPEQPGHKVLLEAGLKVQQVQRVQRVILGLKELLEPAIKEPKAPQEHRGPPAAAAAAASLSR